MMIRADKVETMIVDIPTIRPHVLSVATMSVQSMVLLRIRFSDGTTGIGEASTIGGLRYGNESPEGIKLTIDRYFTPLLLDADASSPATIMSELNRAAVGNHFAKCAVETALLDAMGKRLGAPVSELLGGRLRDELPVLWTLASGDTSRDIAEAEEMLASGRHNTFKLKIGKRTLREDIAHASEIKRALGDRASIRVDVNQAWDELTAKQGIVMLADAGIDLVEQPIAHGNIVGMARLTAAASIAVMADEALKGPTDAFAYAQSASAHVFAVKIAQSGGLRPAKSVGAIADAAGISLYGGTMLEGPVGTVASAHLCSTFTNMRFGTELFGPLLLTESVINNSLDYDNGTLNLPDGPGLGIELNEDVIAHFKRDI